MRIPKQLFACTICLVAAGCLSDDRINVRIEIQDGVEVTDLRLSVCETVTEMARASGPNVLTFQMEMDCGEDSLELTYLAENGERVVGGGYVSSGFDAQNFDFVIEPSGIVQDVDLE